MPSKVMDDRGAPVDMPVRVLRGFEKVRLGTDGSERKKRVDFDLTRRDLSYWDVIRQNWVMPPGDFTVCLGFSSRDLRQCTSLAVGLRSD
jgi:beta-glucosidase